MNRDLVVIQSRHPFKDQDIDKVRKLVLGNCPLTIIYIIIEQVSISFGYCQAILKNHLGLRRIISRTVPRNLNLVQKTTTYSCGPRDTISTRFLSETHYC